MNVVNRVGVEFLSGDKSNFQYNEDKDERNVVDKGDKIYFELDEIQTENPFITKVIKNFPSYNKTTSVST